MKILSETHYIKTIAHCADIHIRNIDRHEEYKRVINRWLKSLKENKIDLICLLGDIAHTKTNISPELVYYVNDLFIRLSKISPVIVILGNHDASLSNPNRMDAIKPIIDIAKINNIFLLQKSDVYRFGNIDFYLSSVIDRNNEIYNKIIDNNQTNIALYHGPIKYSYNEFGYTFDSDISPEIFEKFDITMLGDIHKKQSIKKETIKYCGSLIQQNYGEEIDKGYLIWDIEDKKNQFIKIKNDNAFYTLSTINGNLPEIKIEESHPRIRLFLDRSALKNSSDITSFIKKNFSPIELVTHVKDELDKNIISNKYHLQSYYDSNIQNILIEQFLKNKYNLSNEEIKEVFNINLEMENILKENGYYLMPNYGTSWRVKKLEFDNLFLYGEDNCIDFEKISGVTGIFGANDIGKSALFDILIFSLFGQTGKNLVLEQIVNDKKRTARTFVEIEISSNTYIIERIIDTKFFIKYNDRKILKNILNFYAVENGQQVIINEDDKNKTERKIRNLIGTPEDFISTNMMLQYGGTPFIQDRDTRRKSTLIGLLGLVPLEQKYEKANSITKDMIAVLKELSSRDFKSELSQIIIKINNNEDKKKKIEEEISILKNKLLEVEIEIENLQNMLNVIKDMPSDITILEKDLTKQNELLNTKTNRLYDLKNIFSKMKNEYNNVIKEHNKYDIPQLEIDNKKYEDTKLLLLDLTKRIDKLSFMVNQKLQQLDILKREPWHEFEELCRNCSFMLSAFKNKEELKKHADEADILLKRKREADDIINSLNPSIQLYQKVIENKNNQKTLLDNMKIIKLKISEINGEIEICKVKIKTINEQINNYKYNIEVIEKNKNIQLQIHSNKNLKTKYQESLDNLNNNLMIVMSELKSYYDRKNKIVNEIDRINELERKINIYKYYIEAIHRDNIPYQIVMQVIPHLNHEITHILETTVDFSVEIKAIDDKIVIMIKYANGEERPIEATGGMVNIISGIAIRAALNFISVLPKTDLFAIDEGFSAFDDTVLSSISNLIEFLKSRFKNVFMITHINSLKDIVDNIIDIKRIGGGSKVEI